MLCMLAIALMLNQQPAVPNEMMLAGRKYLPTHCGRKRVALKQLHTSRFSLKEFAVFQLNNSSDKVTLASSDWHISVSLGYCTAALAICTDSITNSF